MQSVASVDVWELIDQLREWADVLRCQDLPSEYDDAVNNFFGFMQSRGCNVVRLSSIIQECSGLDPQQIRAVGDADLLRRCVYQYYGAQLTLKHCGGNGYEVTNQWFRDDREDA